MQARSYRVHASFNVYDQVFEAQHAPGTWKCRPSMWVDVDSAVSEHKAAINKPYDTDTRQDIHEVAGFAHRPKDHRASWTAEREKNILERITTANESLIQCLWKSLHQL